MDYKISVIVPIYGVEKYIERCARTLFEQTLEDIEYIFVKDCTKDRSMEILTSIIKNYPKRKEHIRIINSEQNRGLAETRKKGIKYARGEYFAVCDSDDWVDKSTYETMYTKGANENADIVVCDLYYAYDNILERKKGMINSMHDKFITDMFYQRVPWSSCNKLFKRTLLSNPIHYPTESMGEDFTLTMQLAYFSKKNCYVEQPLYFYYQHEQSMVKMKGDTIVFNKFVQASINLELIVDFYKRTELYKSINGAIAHTCYHTKSLILPLVSKKKYYYIWKNYYPNIEWKILLDNNNSKKDRIKCLLILLRIYPWISNCLGLTKCK